MKSETLVRLGLDFVLIQRKPVQSCIENLLLLVCVHVLTDVLLRCMGTLFVYSVEEVH